MNKLLAQIIKFTAVGGISFFVDFAVYTVMCNLLGIHYQIAGICGFAVSVVVNYILSMRYVFASKEDMSKKKEFIIFVVLSLIGAFINACILYLCVDVIYAVSNGLQTLLSEKWMNILAKIIATFVVMVYNFISRKVFLEKK